MKKLTILFLILCAIGITTEGKGNQFTGDRNSVALVARFHPSLTTREQAIKTILEGYGLTPAIVASSSTFDDLDAYNLVVASENNTLEGDVITQLINAGSKVWLLANAGEAIGGNWNSSSITSYRNLIVEQNASFLDGYQSNLSFEVQYTGTAYTMTSGYPAGWNVIGRNSGSSGNKTVLYREHPTSGGKSLVYTYSPALTSETSRNLYAMMYEWLTGNQVYVGKTVPPGHVAFVITGYDDDDEAPDLTEEELAHQSLLEDYGFEVTFIRPSRLVHSDLSQAAWIVAVEYPSIDLHTINTHVESGKKLMLNYSSGASLGGNWTSSSITSYRNLMVESNEIFLDGYQSNLSFPVQGSGSAYTMSSGYPAGWQVIGRNSGSSGNKTILYREHVLSGGSALIYTYSRDQVSETGRNLYDMMYEWFEQAPAYEGKTVAAGQVAFVMTNYDDNDAAPDLTDQESWLVNLLEVYGYDITYIRPSRMSASDLSQASLIVAAEYPSIDKHRIAQELAAGSKLALHYSSGASLGGSWTSSSITSYRNLIVESNECFLDGYQSNVSALVQSTGTAYTNTSGYPEGWAVIGRNSSSSGNKTVLFSEDATSQGKAVVYTYNLSNPTETARNFFDKMYEWLRGTPMYAGKVVPDNYVAFVISNYNDQASSVDLTPTESGISTSLLDKGYNIEYIRLARLPHTDFSSASMIIAAEYPSLDKHTIEQQLTLGKGVALLYSSAASLGGTWNSSSTSSYHNLQVESATAFLRDYQLGDQMGIQSTGTAYTISSGYPEGWSILGRNTSSSSNKTAFAYEGTVKQQGKGAIFTYNALNYTEEGESIFETIINDLLTTIQTPTVFTSPVTNITQTTATGGGEVIDQGGSAVTAKGLVWSTSPNPTLTANDGYTVDGAGTGEFTSNITGLTPGTTYYVRAYATNDDGTGYGESEEVTTLEEIFVPTVSTSEITDITFNSATSGGNITNDGGSPVTARGVVWSTTQNPTIETNEGITYDGEGTGSWVSELVELTPDTDYYVRAYATNSVGTAYGEQMLFTTLDEPLTEINVIRGGPASTNPLAIPIQITGVNANPYNTNLNQWTGNWQAPQAIYDQGTYVNNPDFWSNIGGNTAAGSTWYNSSPGNGYGILVVDLQQQRQIVNISAFQMFSDGKITHIALAGHPETGSLAPDAFDDEWLEFLSKSPVGAGTNYGSYSGDPTKFTVNTSTRFIKIMAYNDGSLGNSSYIELKGIKMYGGEPAVVLPVVQTAELLEITQTTAQSGGNITSDGGAIVTARGVVWSTTQSPTIETNEGITYDGEGTGSWVSELSGLTPDTEYFVRAYATNSVGTAYGEQQSFTTLPGGPPNWEPNPYLQYNMQIIGQLQYEDGNISMNGNDLVGAFVGEECRGVMSPDPNFMGILFLTIGSDLQSGETVTFKAYVADADMIVDLNESVVFENQQQVGSIPDPFLFTFSTFPGGPPNWEPNPYLQYNMQVIGQLEYEDGNISMNENDIIGAFVGEECRGVMSPDPNFMGIVFLTVGSDLQSGETVTFKAYLADEDRIVDLNESVVFENQQQVGSIPDPFIFSYGDLISHTISLPTGWSGLSSYVIPVQPAMEDVFASISDELIIVQTLTGMYYPGQNINHIGNWESHSAYKVKTNAACMLEITGEYETNMAVQLNAGWNLLPVVTPDGADPADLFMPVNGFVIAKDIAGTGVYWPQYNINSIGNIVPGKAYFVLMTTPGVVDYTGMKSTENMTGLDETLTGYETLSGLGYNITPTPSTHTVAILPEALKDIEVGTIIGAFDQNGNCFGVTIIGEHANHLTIFGNDPTTAEKDGFYEGEMILFKTLTGLDETLSGLSPIFDHSLPQSNGLFAENGLSAITGFEAATGVGNEGVFIQLNIYPNPTDGLLNITGLGVDAEITISNAQGQIVLQGVSQSDRLTTFDLSGCKPGIYFIKIEQNEETIFRKVVLK